MEEVNHRFIFYVSFLSKALECALSVVDSAMVVDCDMIYLLIYNMQCVVGWDDVKYQHYTTPHNISIRLLGMFGGKDRR